MTLVQNPHKNAWKIFNFFVNKQIEEVKEITSGKINPKTPLIFDCCVFENDRQRHLFHFFKPIQVFFFTFFRDFYADFVNLQAKFFSPIFWKNLKKIFEKKYLVRAGIEPTTIHSIVIRSTNYSTVLLLSTWYFPSFLIR